MHTRNVGASILEILERKGYRLFGLTAQEIGAMLNKQESLVSERGLGTILTGSLGRSSP